MTMTPDQCFDEMAVVLGLPKDTGYTDILAVVKKLKEQLAIKEAEQEEEANLICSLKERVEELEADVPPDCCEGCGERFDLQYTVNHADKELREKYDKYMGSEDDDGDLCQICLDSNY